MRLVFLTVLSAILPLLGSAQIRFAKTRHSVGAITEGSMASYRFSFRNQGTKPVEVEAVIPGCNCIRAELPKTSYAQGDTGSLLISFNSAGYVGPFTKSIIFRQAGEAQATVLILEGEVTPKTADEFKYVDTVGELALDKKVITHGIFRTNEDRDFVIHVKNIGKKPISFVPAKTQAKAAWKLNFEAASLKPGQVGSLTLSYTGAQSKASGWKDKGAVADSIVFFTDEKDKAAKLLVVNGTYNHVWSSEELAQAPKIEFEATEFNGGNILQGDQLTQAFKFKNTGKTDLIINSAKASCGCTAIEPSEKIIKPGQSSEIVARFNSAGKEGAQHKTITVNSNDPVNPNVVLHLKCTITVDPFKQSDKQ